MLHHYFYVNIVKLANKLEKHKATIRD